MSAWPLWRAGGLSRLVAGCGVGLGATTLLILAISQHIDVVAMTIIALFMSLWSAASGLYLLLRKT